MSGPRTENDADRLERRSHVPLHIAHLGSGTGRSQITSSLAVPDLEAGGTNYSTRPLKKNKPSIVHYFFNTPKM